MKLQLKQKKKEKKEKNGSWSPLKIFKFVELYLLTIVASWGKQETI